jgi:hypothetical protein
MAFPIGAAIIGGAGVLGSLLSSSSQSDAAQKAAEETAKVQWDMFNITRDDYAPYRDVGIDALYQLAGYEKVPKTEQVETPTYKTQRVRNPAYKWDDPSAAPEYITQKVRTGTTTIPKESYTWEKTGAGIDPTGGAEQYKNQLADLTFQFDPNDPVYKWRKGQNDEALNNFLSSRGLYNSSYGLNQLENANMALQSDEVNRQYNQNYLRQYGQTVDLFNMADKLGSETYDKYLNLTNLGYGATGATAAAGANTANQITSSVQNQYATQGAAQGAFWSGLGAAPANALVAYGYGKDAGLWK